MTTSSFLDKLCPLVLDGSSSVRTQLLKLLQSLPAAENTDHVSKLLPHIRAGMTHLSKDIRMSSIELLSWIISVAGKELVSCAGGWYKTLECFTTVLGWRSTDTGKWSSSNPAFGDTKSTARAMAVLAEFLEAGLFQKITKQTVNILSETFPLWQLEYHGIPTKSNAYSHLNLFGAPRHEKSQMLEDREDRLRVYNATFAGLVNAGISASRKEGGDLGRAAGILVKVLERAEKDAPED
jgi:pre-rRNA-processing protein IPI1